MNWTRELVLLGIGALLVGAPLAFSEIPKLIGQIILWGGILCLVAGIGLYAYDKVRRHRGLKSDQKTEVGGIQGSPKPEYIPLKEPKPDIDMGDVYCWIENRLSNTLSQNQLSQEAAKIFPDIRQAAADGEITIWGREIIGTSLSSNQPLQPIEASYWLKADFDIVNYFLDNSGAHRSDAKQTKMLDVKQAPIPIYTGLIASEEQVLERWPQHEEDQPTL